MSLRHTVIIGEKEFAIHKIPAFQANLFILKLQKIAGPIIGSMSGSKDVMGMDTSVLFEAISTHIDEKVMADLVMPMFIKAQVVSMTDQQKIDSEASFNKVFDTDNLFDAYELIFEVLKFNFGNFFVRLASRFGDKNGVSQTQDTTPGVLAS